MSAWLLAGLTGVTRWSLAATDIGGVRMRQSRVVVHIDEALCNGCGECVPNCAEGAIQIIDGKARLGVDAEGKVI